MASQPLNEHDLTDTARIRRGGNVVVLELQKHGYGPRFYDLIDLYNKYFNDQVDNTFYC